MSRLEFFTRFYPLNHLLPHRICRCCTVAAAVLLRYSCCSAAAAVRLLQYCCCGMAAAVLLLWYDCCGTAAAVRLLLYGCCSAAAVLRLLLLYCCCHCGTADTSVFLLSSPFEFYLHSHQVAYLVQPSTKSKKTLSHNMKIKN